jgi:hypothetical protein
MTKWAYNGQPRCQKCKRFISREIKDHLCDDCYSYWYQQIGKVPDEQIPRAVMKEYRRQEAKRQSDIEQDRQWQDNNGKATP